jgi:acetylornithine deacetylase/succinyl-diaminopimelate desuccinylase-like protein
MRLVPDQEPAAIAAALEQYIQTLCPPGATATLRTLSSAPPILVPTDGPIMDAAGAALQEVFGRPPVFTRMGGSIPIVALFMERLRAPCVMMCFGLPDDNLHAPNEKMRLANITRGVAASQSFLRRLRR